MVSGLQDDFARFWMATGSGKSRILFELARIAYLQASKGQHVVIVTPFIDLVKQLLSKFIEFRKCNTTQDVDLTVPLDAIKTVSSDSESNKNSQLSNIFFAKQKSITIFCSVSFFKRIDEDPTFLDNIPLYLLDEYHLYHNNTINLSKKLSTHQDKKMLLGFTATPPKEDTFKTTAFSYTFLEGVKDGYLAPIQVGKLGGNYSKENVNILTRKLPSMVTNQNHPGFTDKKLKDLKGIIYLPSVKHCQEANIILEEYGIKCYGIHNENTNSDRDLKDFIKNKKPCVAVACKKLSVGFDCKDVMWEIDGKGANTSYESKINKEQMIGRLSRKENNDDNKTGYILSFNDVADNVIQPLIEKHQEKRENMLPYFNYSGNNHFEHERAKNDTFTKNKIKNKTEKKIEEKTNISEVKKVSFSQVKNNNNILGMPKFLKKR